MEVAGVLEVVPHAEVQNIMSDIRSYGSSRTIRPTLVIRLAFSSEALKQASF